MEFTLSWYRYSYIGIPRGIGIGIIGIGTGIQVSTGKDGSTNITSEVYCTSWKHLLESKNNTEYY